MLLSDRFFAMGTRVESHLHWIVDEVRAAGALTAIREEVGKVDSILSAFRPGSALCRLNSALKRTGRAAVDDPMLLEALLLAKQMFVDTNGLFDVTIGSATLARADDAPVPARVGFDHVEIDSTRGEVRGECGMAFDFGGLGKGIALDSIRTVLHGYGRPSGLVSMGGSSVLALGSHPFGNHWPLALPHPGREGETLATFELFDESWSVSANVMDRGSGRVEPHPHVLRPETTERVTPPRTTVVVDKSAARAEGFSTALLVAESGERSALAAHLQDARAWIFDFRPNGGFNMTKFDRTSLHDGTPIR